MMHSGFVRCALAALVATGLLAACEPEPMDYRQNPTLPTYPQLSLKAPPPPMREDAPASMNAKTEFWRSGYWEADGDDFTWVRGETLPRPAPTAVWVPAQWVQHNYGWAFIAGHWQ